MSLQRAEDDKLYNQWAGQQSVVQRNVGQTLHLSSEVSMPDTWRFGVERELTLRPNLARLEGGQMYGDLVRAMRSPDGRLFSWSQVAQILLATMRYALERSHGWSVYLPEVGQMDYLAWSIVGDGSIHPEPGFLEHPDLADGFEIISPVFSTSDEDDWLAEMQSMWSVLTAFFDVQPSLSCGTHVHISPGKGAWTTTPLIRLAKSIVYYDPLIDALVPEARHGLLWCPSNIFADGVAQDLPGGFARVFEHIDFFATGSPIRDFIHYMSPERLYAWNFRNLKNDCGTVELHRPPMSRKVDEAILWMKFAIAFVKATTRQDLSNVLGPNQGTPKLSDLQNFVMSHNVALEPLFAGKFYHHLMTRRNPATLQDIELLRKKKAKKSLFKDKMKLAQHADQRQGNN